MLSRVPVVVAKKHPTIHDVHDAAAVLAKDFEELKEVMGDVEAVGMNLYHLAPPELVSSFIENDGGMQADLD